MANAVNQTSEFITKTPLRISFPTLWATKPDMNGRERFTAEFLVDKSDTETIAAINACIQTAAVNKFGTGPKAPKAPKNPVFDGDGAKPSGSAWPEEYAGQYVIRASANADHPPLLRDEYGHNLREMDNGATKIYGGCYVYAVLRFWAYDNNGNKGVSASIQQVMFAKDGEAFGGGHTDPSALDQFAVKSDNPFAAFM